MLTHSPFIQFFVSYVLSSWSVVVVAVKVVVLRCDQFCI